MTDREVWLRTIMDEIVAATPVLTTEDDGESWKDYDEKRAQC